MGDKKPSLRQIDEKEKIKKIIHETLSLGYANQIKIATLLSPKETQKIIDKMNEKIGDAFFEAMNAVTTSKT